MITELPTCIEPATGTSGPLIGPNDVAGLTGIVIGCVCGVAFIAGSLFRLYRKRKPSRSDPTMSEQTSEHKTMSPPPSTRLSAVPSSVNEEIMSVRRSLTTSPSALVLPPLPTGSSTSIQPMSLHVLQEPYVSVAAV